MAGVSSVKVAPEDRGRGVGRLLMTAVLDEIAAHRYPLSALYPATMPLYRSLGWELAGGRHIRGHPGEVAARPGAARRGRGPASQTPPRCAGPGPSTQTP